MNLPPAEDFVSVKRAVAREPVVKLLVVSRYVIYSRGSAYYHWFIVIRGNVWVVPARQLRALGFSELDKPFKDREGRNTASHTSPVAILAVSTIYTDIFFAKCFCPFLNRRSHSRSVFG